jgi:HEAT repeat protein
MTSVWLRPFALAAFCILSSVPSLFAQDGKGGREPAPNLPSVEDLINDLRNGDVSKKTAALRQLEAWGPKAKAAIPDLIGALQNKDASVRGDAVNALGAIGPDAKEALPSLRQLLRDSKFKNDYGNHSIAHAIVNISQSVDLEVARILVGGSTPKTGTSLVLSYLNKYSAELTPHLIVLLDDIDAHIRSRSADAFMEMTKSDKGQDSILKKLGDKAKPIGPALVKHLDDMDDRVAMAVANALTHVDPELGTKAIPHVIRILKQKDAKVHSHHTAAEILQPVAKAAIPQLIDALDDKDAVVRGQIANTVCQLTGVHESLITALKHEKMYIRAGAAKALAINHSGGLPVADALEVALKDSERVVRFAAADALVWVDIKRAQAIVPALVETIREGDEAEQTHAVGLLKHIGPPAKSATPDLLKLLGDKRFSVRFEAALALTVIDANERVQGVRVLIEGASSDNNVNQHRAAKALATIGPAAKEAVPALQKLYQSKYVHARYSAAEAVAVIDPSKVESAVQVLTAILTEPKSRYGMVKTYVLSILRKIGPAAKSALPTLDELLKDDDGPFQGEVAATAICLAPNDAKAARAFLREHLSKENVDDEAYDFVEVLPSVGANARHFMAEIQMVLAHSKNSYFQEQVCESIAAIGPDAKELEPLLNDVIAKSKKKSTIEAAEKALKAIGAKK